MLITSPLTLTERLALTLDGLCKAVAARIAGGAMSELMILMIWNRVRRIEHRLLRLLARYRAGRLWTRVAAPSGGRAGTRRGEKVPVLPRDFAWLLPLVPFSAAGFASQFRVVLEEPEMVGLLAASPQARRVLAPLCRMLGIEAALLTPRVAGDAGADVEAAGLAGEPAADGAAAMVPNRDPTVAIGAELRRARDISPACRGSPPGGDRTET